MLRRDEALTDISFILAASCSLWKRSGIFHSEVLWVGGTEERWHRLS